ncbi:fatty acid desaturase family protein [Lysinimonas soli]|uniref:Fatty acid desaturase family protein n=1 Tax=Lysinimonas soli TaxID=1074233 RepID=A0ABW0NP68_9MICO
MSPISSLGAVRSTVPRVAGASSPISSYSQLLSTVRGAGLLERSKVFYASVFATLVVALGGAVTGFVLLGDSWFQLLIAGALGIIFTQFAFLGHEASHRAVFASGKANDRAGRALAVGVVGISYSWWMNKHTRHHANPNMIGKDPDIAVDTISFVEEDAASATGLRALITRHQAALFFPFLLFEGINLHVKSFGHLFGRGKVDGRGIEIALIAVRMSILVVAIFAVLPLGMAFAFLGVQLAVFGVYMGASFAPNHIGMEVVPAGAKLDFLNKQVLTSRNVSGGFWMSVLMGGLNYQIEHHLFPSMSRPHLSRTRRLVRETCAREGIPYTETTLRRAYVIVLSYLKQVGSYSGFATFDCPMVGQYRRV